jgi:hypothetical protein
MNIKKYILRKLKNIIEDIIGIIKYWRERNYEYPERVCVDKWHEKSESQI